MHTHTLSQYIPNTVMYVDVGENRDLLESFSFSFVSWDLDHLFVGDCEL